MMDFFDFKITFGNILTVILVFYGISKSYFRLKILQETQKATLDALENDLSKLKVTVYPEVLRDLKEIQKDQEARIRKLEDNFYKLGQILIEIQWIKSKLDTL